MRTKNVECYGIENGVEMWRVECCGASTETKPTTGIVSGSVYFATDTGDVYVYDEASATWKKQ